MTTAPEQGKGPLLLLDGMSLAFRAYFALPPDLARADGTVTNAVHGFASMLVYLVREHHPSAVAVAFDLWTPTFRDELIDDYKGGRDETPPDLLPQFDLIRGLLGALAIPVVHAEGYEADDILATLATRARDQGRDVVVVSGDRDCFQLVEDPHVRVLYNRRGVSDYSLYDEAGILDRTGVRPATYPMLASLRGDPSDNLPGIPGVGEKTAAKLLNTYGDLDGIFEHLDELTPKLRQNLAEHRDRAMANARVIPLVRDVPLTVTDGEVALGGWDAETLRQELEGLELRTLWRRLRPLLDAGDLGLAAAGSGPLAEEVDGTPSVASTTPDATASAPSTTGAATPGLAPSPDDPPAPTKVTMVLTSDPSSSADALAQLRRTGGSLGLVPRFQGPAGRSPLVGLALVPASDPTQGTWLPGAHLDEPAVRAALGALLGDDGISLVGHDVKELLRTLLPLGVDATRLDLDEAVAAYLIDPSTGEYRLADVLAAWCPGGAPDGLAVGATPSVGQLALIEDEGEEGGSTADATADLAGRAGLEAAALLAAAGPLRRALEHDGVTVLHDDVERPLVRVLARMEVAGIRVDEPELRRISDELATEAASLEGTVHDLAGHEFNVNSTPQLRTVLFEELGLTPGRKTKTGYSTDAATLEKLRDNHPIVAALLRYREVEKLRSTYGESLLAEVTPDGRIHATFRQTVARTGRLSSEHPNLHNIPVRTELGRRFRRAFVPEPGAGLLVADYDQIELRVLAHLSDDPGLLEAFQAGTDIHRAVASGVYGVPMEEVTSTQRERAKMVSYGLAYGMEAYGLARRLATGVEEANEVMSGYFRAFPQVRSYMESTVEEARERGFTRTALGRKRPLPELNDSSYRVRQAAERQAMNAGIQGLAADLFKTALVRLDAALEEEGLGARLVLQVHDEVLVEVPEPERDRVEALTRDALTGAVELSVPLEVSMSWGQSWAAAKGG